MAEVFPFAEPENESERLAINYLRAHLSRDVGGIRPIRVFLYTLNNAVIKRFMTNPNSVQPEQPSVG